MCPVSVTYRPGYGQECQPLLFKVNFEDMGFQSCLKEKVLILEMVGTQH